MIRRAFTHLALKTEPYQSAALHREIYLSAPAINALIKEKARATPDMGKLHFRDAIEKVNPGITIPDSRLLCDELFAKTADDLTALKPIGRVSSKA